MVKFKALHRLFGKLRRRNKNEEKDNSVSRGGQSPRGSIWRKKIFVSPTNGSRSNRNGRKVKVLTVISSLFKTSKGKPMSNNDGKDDEPQVKEVLNAAIDDVTECDLCGCPSSLCTLTSAATLQLEQQNTKEVNKVVTQTLDWELASSSLTSISSLSSLTTVTELSECFPSQQSLTKDDFDSDADHGEIKLAAADDLKQITRKGNDVTKDDDMNFWKRYMLAVCIVFVLLLLI